MRVRALAAFMVLAAIAPALRGERLPVRLYTADDGLGSNYINRIVQDSRGFLWFCTREGLSRFDGYQFTNFGRDQGLPGSVQDLLETRSGEYWAATEDGVAHLNTAASQPQFTVYRPASSKARQITSLIEDGAGGIWCGTDGGLYRLEKVQANPPEENAQFKLHPVDIGMPTVTFNDTLIEALLRDRHGNLWIAAGSGLYRRTTGGRFERYLLGEGPSRNHALSLAEDHDGRLWVGTWEGLLRISLRSDLSGPIIEKVYSMKNGLPDSRIGALLESSNGQLWIGTSRGLSRYVCDGAREGFESYTDVNGLIQNEVTALGEDRAGNLWVGATGAHKISRGGFVTYGQQDGLATRVVSAIIEDRARELCAITESPGAGHGAPKYVNCFDGRRFHPVLPNVPNQIKYWGWGDHQITFQDHIGEWWVPTGEGLFRFPRPLTLTELNSAHPKAVYNARNGLPGDVFRAFEDSRGDVWIATQCADGSGLLTRWERRTGTLHHYSAADGVPTTLAYAFAEDGAGNVWIGFHGALTRYRDGRFQCFDAPKNIERFFIRWLYLDQKGRLWAACRNGVVRIDSPEAAPQFTTYTTAQGLASNDAQCITEDQWGRIYVGMGRGVDCFLPEKPLHIKHYTKADGLALGNGMQAFRDHQGALWFGGSLGLSRLEPKPEGSPVRPLIVINALRVKGVPRPISPLGVTELSGLRLGSNQNQVELDFVGLGFGAGEALRYQYRLEGADTDWSRPTDERRIDYASLSPGSYRFLVRAVSTGGLVSARPASVEFTILAPIWQRWWMRMLFMTIAAAIVYLLYRHRVSRLLEMERLRTRIASDLHDDVGSTLSQIAILSEVASRNARTQEQLESLSEIAGLSRDSVDSMSDIVWAIDPEQDRLGDLSRRMRRFANDLLASNGIGVQFHPPAGEENPEISPEMRRQVFLIFKESLHNTARHSACTDVEIDFDLEKGRLGLTVRDNGKGFDMTHSGKGHGLASMEKRAKELHGQVTVESAPGQGTTVRLRAPVG